MGMIPVKCPNCGADIQLDNSREFGFCNYCGTKVIQEKVVVKHEGNVKVDSSDEKNNLIIAARNAVEVGNEETALKMYERLLVLDPNNWEAQFFPLFLKSSKLTNGEIHSYAHTLLNSFGLVFRLIRDYTEDKESQLAAIHDVIEMSYTESLDLLASSLNFRKTLNKGNGYMALSGVTGAISSISSGITNNSEDTQRALTISNILWSCGDTIESTFDMSDDDFSKCAVLAWKKSLDLNKEFRTSRHFDLFDRESLNRITKKINKYDNSYEIIPIVEPKKKEKLEKVYGKEFADELTQIKYSDKKLESKSIKDLIKLFFKSKYLKKVAIIFILFIIILLISIFVVMYN